LSAAILDHALSDGDTSKVRERLKERNIPSSHIVAYDDVCGTCREGVHVKKPASMSMLVVTIKSLLAQR
jgi:hypothetical protein